MSRTVGRSGRPPLRAAAQIAKAHSIVVDGVIAYGAPSEHIRLPLAILDKHDRDDVAADERRRGFKLASETVASCTVTIGTTATARSPYLKRARSTRPPAWGRASPVRAAWIPR